MPSQATEQHPGQRDLQTCLSSGARGSPRWLHGLQVGENHSARALRSGFVLRPGGHSSPQAMGHTKAHEGLRALTALEASRAQRSRPLWSAWRSAPAHPSPLGTHLRVLSVSS